MHILVITSKEIVCVAGYQSREKQNKKTLSVGCEISMGTSAVK